MVQECDATEFDERYRAHITGKNQAKNRTDFNFEFSILNAQFLMLITQTTAYCPLQPPT